MWRVSMWKASNSVFVLYLGATTTYATENTGAAQPVALYVRRGRMGAEVVGADR
jgi:hypothetical protein